MAQLQGGEEKAIRSVPGFARRTVRLVEEMAPATPKPTRVPPKPSTRCEGRLQIARFGQHPQIAPTKTRYVATFTPYLLGSVWGLKSRYLEGEEALKEFLRHLGLSAERVREAVAKMQLREMAFGFDVQGAEVVTNDPFIDNDDKCGMSWTFSPVLAQ